MLYGRIAQAFLISDGISNTGGRIFMKNWKKLTTLLLTGALMAGVIGCGVPANTVNSPDDMAGKKIGVQLGTTGEIGRAHV